MVQLPVVVGAPDSTRTDHATAADGRAVPQQPRPPEPRKVTGEHRRKLQEPVGEV